MRVFLLLIASVQFFFAIAFALSWPIAEALWPLPYTNPQSLLFVGSIFAAAAAATLWCALSNELGAVVGIGLDYLVIFVPLTIFALQVARGRPGPMLWLGIAMGLGALFGLGLLLWSRRIPMRDTRPTPILVRVVFGVFIVALLFAGGAMVLKQPNIVPWHMTSVGSVVYGWMFLGAAAYFAYALIRPVWTNAVGQLLGFLAYDLVLVGPFLAALPDIREAWRINLIVYIIIVVGSGLFALYYLFIHPRWRIVRSQREPAQVTKPAL
jgi:hypothetical protein